MSAGNDVQAAVTAYWNYRAKSYDRAAGHNVRGPEERAAWLEALRELLPPAPADVLDVGTGTGFVALFAAELGHRVVGVDLAEAMLERARAKAAGLANPPEFRLGDAVAPPFPPESFDAVISRHVLWTLRDPDAAFRNWFTLLRPGGCAVAIDSFWFTSASGRTSNDEDEEERRQYWDRYYSDEVQRRLPLMHGSQLEPVCERFRAAGFHPVEARWLERIRALEADVAPEPRYAIVAVKPR